MKELNVLDNKITYFNIDNEDYISLTDMLKSKAGDFFISDWLRNRGLRHTVLDTSRQEDQEMPYRWRDRYLKSPPSFSADPVHRFR